MDAPIDPNSQPPQALRSRDDVVRLSREDLVASVEAFRARSWAWPARLHLIGFIGGLATGPILMGIGGMLGWPAGLDAYFFFQGWAIALTFAVFGVRRERRIRADLQWHCSHCDAPLIAPDRSGSLVRAETAIASGRCPVCGEELFGNGG